MCNAIVSHQSNVWSAALYLEGYDCLTEIAEVMTSCRASAKPSTLSVMCMWARWRLPPLIGPWPVRDAFTHWKPIGLDCGNRSVLILILLQNTATIHDPKGDHALACSLRRIKVIVIIIATPRRNCGPLIVLRDSLRTGGGTCLSGVIEIHEQEEEEQEPTDTTTDGAPIWWRSHDFVFFELE